MTALFRLLWLGLLALTPSPATPLGDGLVLDADASVLALPVDRSLSVSGSGEISVVDGTTQLAIPKGAFMELNGEPVHGRFPVSSGDALRVRLKAGGAVVWDLAFGEAFSDAAVQQQRAAEMGAFLTAVGRGSGGVGRFRDAAAATVAPVVIGVTTAPPDAGLAAQLGVSPDASLRVLDVSAGLPAQQAGVQAHDVIVSVDGVEVVTKQSLSEIIGSHAPGEMVALEILRRGERIQLAVPVIGRAEAEAAREQLDRSRATESQFNALERALHDHKDMASHLAARLSDLENERLSRELTLAELHARLEQRESRVAEMNEQLALLHETSEKLSRKLLGVKPEHSMYADLMRSYERAQVDANLTAQRLDQERAGLDAVREDLAAVSASVEAAAHHAELQRREMLEVQDGLAALMAERNGLARQMAIVESSEGSEALLLADSLAAYQRARELDDRAQVEDAERQAVAQELAAMERVEVARRTAELAARDVQREHERASAEAARLHQYLERARQEAEVIATMEAERAQLRAAEIQAMQQQLALEAAEAHADADAHRVHQQQAERAEAAYMEALALVEARAAEQQDLGHSTQQRLESIEDRLARIEQLLERLLASQPQ